MGESDNSFKKTFCLTNQLFGLGTTNSFGLGAPSFQGHKLPQSISVVKITVAALKLQVAGVAILSVQFLIHVIDVHLPRLTHLHDARRLSHVRGVSV